MNFMNESNIDRILRVVGGIVLLVLGWGSLVTGTVGEVFKWVGLLALLTGLAGFCPVYWVLKFRTNKK